MCHAKVAVLEVDGQERPLVGVLALEIEGQARPLGGVYLVCAIFLCVGDSGTIGFVVGCHSVGLVKHGHKVLVGLDRIVYRKALTLRQAVFDLYYISKFLSTSILQYRLKI